MPKMRLNLQQVTDLREDGVVSVGDYSYRTELDAVDGPGRHWTWVVRAQDASGQVTYWRTLYQVSGPPGEVINSLFESEWTVFEQIPACGQVCPEGYVRFDDGAVTQAHRTGAAPSQGVRPGKPALP